MLRIAHLHARYAGQPVLQDINLQLDSHELLVVLGPPAAAKLHCSIWLPVSCRWSRAASRWITSR